MEDALEFFTKFGKKTVSDGFTTQQTRLVITVIVARDNRRISQMSEIAEIAGVAFCFLSRLFVVEIT